MFSVGLTIENYKGYAIKYVVTSSSRTVFYGIFKDDVFEAGYESIEEARCVIDNIGNPAEIWRWRLKEKADEFPF